MKKKAQVALNQIVPIVLILVTAGIVIGAGTLILGKFQDKMAGTTSNTSYYVTGNATEGVKELATFVPTIGIIIAAVIIIGLIVGSFAGATKR